MADDEQTTEEVIDKLHEVLDQSALLGRADQIMISDPETFRRGRKSAPVFVTVGNPFRGWLLDALMTAVKAEIKVLEKELKTDDSATTGPKRRNGRSSDSTKKSRRTRRTRRVAAS